MIGTDYSVEKRAHVKRVLRWHLLICHANRASAPGQAAALQTVGTGWALQMSGADGYVVSVGAEGAHRAAT